MFALRIGVLVVDGVTLAEVTPARERLEGLGARVTCIIPGGASLLPVSGRYFPAAGGLGERRALAQISPSDVDVLLLPDSVTPERLLRNPRLLAFLRDALDGGQQIPVLQISYLQHLLDRNTSLQGLYRPNENLVAGSPHHA